MMRMPLKHQQIGAVGARREGCPLPRRHAQSIPRLNCDGLGPVAEFDAARSADQLQPAGGLGGQGHRQHPTPLGLGAPESHRSLDRHGTVPPFGIDQQRPAPIEEERLLLVAGGRAVGAGFNPDLQQPAGLRPSVHLTVQQPAPRTHALHLPRLEAGAVSHRILMGQHPLHHHGDDFHVAVRMQAETPAGGDAVVVDHPQRPKAPPGRVIMPGKAEGMPAVEPVVLAVKTFGRRAMDQAGSAFKAAGGVAAAGGVGHGGIGGFGVTPHQLATGWAHGIASCFRALVGR